MLKKSMDVIDLAAWVKASRPLLANSFIDNIYYDGKKWYWKLRASGRVSFLVTQPGAAIYLSPREPAVKEIDNLARFARSKLRDGKVSDIGMSGWERIAYFDVLKGDEAFRVYVELLPRGFLVIVKDGVISYANKFATLRDRAIKPGLQYAHPPPRGLEPSDESALISAISGGKDLVRALVQGWGVPGYVAEEIIYRCGLYNLKNSPLSNISDDDRRCLARAYIQLLEEASSGAGYLVLQNGSPYFVSPYTPRLLTEHYLLEAKKGDLNEVLDAYFAKLEELEALEAERKKLEEEVEELSERIRKQEELISGFQEELNAISSSLRLIYENYEKVERALKCADDARRAKGWQSVVEECEDVIGVSKERGLVKLRVGGEVIELSCVEPLSRQLVELEKRKGEVLRKIERAREVLEELRRARDDKKAEADKALARVSPPRAWYERYHWLFTRNNFLAIGGRDASQNESVVKKYLRDSDIFIHANIQGGSATVLITEGREPSADDIRDAATIAACYSKAWKAGFGFIDVYWARGSQVSKSPPSGEYLGRGAFMVYGEKNFINVPLKLAIGVEVVCDAVLGKALRLAIAPPEIASDKLAVYAIIEPGDEDPGEVASELARLLSEKFEKEHGVRVRIEPSLILERLPGRSRIVKVTAGKRPAACEELI